MFIKWEKWLSSVWPSLVKGKRVRVPSWLPHPSKAGFQGPPLAEPIGQSKDWVLSLRDGSRLHVHEYSDGTLVLHRDRTDPGRGLGHAFWHWISESISGKLALGAGAFLGFVALIDMADREDG